MDSIKIKEPKKIRHHHHRHCRHEPFIMILIIVLPTLGFSGSAGHSIGTQASFGPEKLKRAKPDIIFIGPEYDHRLPLSITDSCSVDLTQNFFCVVAVAVEESVENRLVTAGQAWQQLDNSVSTFSYSLQYFLSNIGITCCSLFVSSLYTLPRALNPRVRCAFDSVCKSAHDGVGGGPSQPG